VQDAEDHESPTSTASDTMPERVIRSFLGLPSMLPHRPRTFKEETARMEGKIHTGWRQLWRMEAVCEGR
jgi:hypothetical protein